LHFAVTVRPNCNGSHQRFQSRQCRRAQFPSALRWAPPNL